MQQKNHMTNPLCQIRSRMLLSTEYYFFKRLDHYHVKEISNQNSQIDNKHKKVSLYESHSFHVNSVDNFGN